jgi:glycosyltransferase involved in cell wall biosynthesis
MRIALVSEYPRSPDGGVGGVQAVVRRLATEMARRSGLEVHVVSCELGRKDSTVETLEGVRVHRFPASSRFGNLTLGFGERRTTARALASIAPDIVHAHVLGAASLGAADAGGPWVTTAHGIQDAYGRQLPAGVANRVRAWAITRMERMCLKRARHLIVISPYVREYFGDRLRSLRTHEIVNPVADEFFHRDGPGDPSVVVFSGRIVPLKDPETLLEAAGRLASGGVDFRLRLVGPADDAGYVESLRRRAAALGIGLRVELPGAVPPESLARELAGAGVLVLPSRQETASVAIMEAMAVGLPVVATDVGGTRYLVEDGVTGALVPPGDAERLAEALRGYLEDPGRSAAHGLRGRRIAEERFRVDRVVDRTLEVYRAVLGEESGLPDENRLDRETVIR